MKKQSNTLFASLTKVVLENLINEAVVKETIATGLLMPEPKIFTAAELWNIQRQGKSRVQRRYL